MSKTLATTGTMDELSDSAAKSADQALSATRRVANDALDSLQSNVDRLRESVPSAFHRAATQVEELTKRGMERAKEATSDVRDQVHKAGDRTVGYIKDEPVKSVLIAAATGAAVALLVGWAMRQRSQR